MPHGVGPQRPTRLSALGAPAGRERFSRLRRLTCGTATAVQDSLRSREIVWRRLYRWLVPRRQACHCEKTARRRLSCLHDFGSAQ